MKYILVLVIGFVLSFTALAQPVPAAEENIPFLVTFGKMRAPNGAMTIIAKLFL
jgi:hypothetical protein